MHERLCVGLITAATSGSSMSALALFFLGVPRSDCVCICTIEYGQL